jgi:hypothetical protein
MVTRHHVIQYYLMMAHNSALAQAFNDWFAELDGVMLPDHPLPRTREKCKRKIAFASTVPADCTFVMNFINHVVLKFPSGELDPSHSPHIDTDTLWSLMPDPERQDMVRNILMAGLARSGCVKLVSQRSYSLLGVDGVTVNYRDVAWRRFTRHTARNARGFTVHYITTDPIELHAVKGGGAADDGVMELIRTCSGCNAELGPLPPLPPVADLT